MNENEWWSPHIKNFAIAALTSLTNIYPGCPIYLDSLFYYFFDYIKREANIPIELFEIKKVMGPKTSEDTVVVLGAPNSLTSFLPNINRQARTIFLTVPVQSFTFKFHIMRTPVNAVIFSGFCFPFSPRLKCLHLPIGSFSNFFLESNSFQIKALKASIITLAKIFGSFNRVYGVGELSSKIASKVVDNLSHIPTGNNNLVLLDRTLDLLTPLRFNESYIGYIEELYNFEEFDLFLHPSVHKALFKRLTGVTGVNDTLFDELSLLTLQEAKRRLSIKGVSSATENDLKNYHLQILNNIDFLMKDQYLLELFLQVQHNEKDPVTQARILGVHESGPALSFRALSVLRAQGKKSAEAYARYLGQAFGVQTFAKWARIDDYLQKVVKCDAPSRALQMGTRIGPLVSVFAQIINDEWRRPNFPVQPNYLYTSTQLSDNPQRWFVIIPGGICGNELALMRSLAKSIRPNDEFAFMPTHMFSPTALMNEILK